MSINTNPFRFTYDSHEKKIKFCNDNARDLRVINKISGNYYLKCTYIVYFKTYNKYEPEPETQKITTLHFSIPNDLHNNLGEIDLTLFDDNQNLKSQDSSYFTSWKKDYERDECKYTELYVPQFIEWVMYE
jgi:hypothetical protein